MDLGRAVTDKPFRPGYKADRGGRPPAPSCLAVVAAGRCFLPPGKAGRGRSVALPRIELAPMGIRGPRMRHARGIIASNRAAPALVKVTTRELAACLAQPRS